MSNVELIAAFEADAIAPASFSHENHVRVAWGLAREYGETDGLERMIIGVKAMAVRAGKPDAYHATITRAWFDLIATIEDLDAAPELLDKSILKRFYSADLLAEGRSHWIEPDLHPLRFPLPATATDPADASR
jgi:hypothetical protein